MEERVGASVHRFQSHQMTEKPPLALWFEEQNSASSMRVGQCSRGWRVSSCEPRGHLLSCSLTLAETILGVCVCQGSWELLRRSLASYTGMHVND